MTGMAVGAGSTTNAGSNSDSSIMGSIPTIQGEHSYQDDLAKINPQWDPNSIEWGENCQRCVSAYEARRRGFDVTAQPAKRGYDDMCYVMPVEKGVFSPYSGADPQNVSANSGTQVELNIDSLMEEWGDGARAIVCVQWKGGGGHAFIAERVNGHTRYLDPQANEIDAKGHFIIAKGSGAWCGRIDNLPFTPRIHECCAQMR